MKFINLKIGNRTFFAFALLVGIAVAFAACSRLNEGVAKVNTGPDGVAVRGYDTVALFAESGLTKGNPAHEYVWNGAKWLFSNAENLEKFKANPETYAPQFGGYCSYAVSHGYTADGDPETWKIVDGKLYLNYNQKAKEAWEAEQQKFIKDGEKNWTEFLKKKPEHKG
jgi:YHS domain-containing protein